MVVFSLFSMAYILFELIYVDENMNNYSYNIRIGNNYETTDENITFIIENETITISIKKQKFK